MRIYDDPMIDGPMINGPMNNGPMINGAANGASGRGSTRVSNGGSQSPVAFVDHGDIDAGSTSVSNGGSESLAAVWITRRNCGDMDPNVFFPHDGAGVVVAQKVCAKCPVKVPCRDYALANNITHGVWGGTSERQRRRILRDRRSAMQQTG